TLLPPISSTYPPPTEIYSLSLHDALPIYRPLDPESPLYRGALAQLAAVTLEIIRWRAKFKLGQNRPVEARRQVIAELRKRGRPNDGRAADALQWTIDAR